jgi:hypothetical protein
VIVGTILQINSGFVTTLGVLYFWFICKNWLYLAIFGCILGVISFFGTLFFIPESPKFLISLKRYDEAREAISYIAKMNGKPAFN